MIIGVDARELEGKATGVGNYLLNILQRLTLPAGVTLELFFKNEIPSRVDGIAAEKILLKSSRNLSWQQWRLPGELKKRLVDAFFSPNGSCPLLFGGMQIITVHDLSFFRHPEWFTLRDRFLRQRNASLSVRRAQRIYVDTEHIRHELLARMRVSESRVIVTGIGVSEKKTDPALRDVLRRSYGLQQRNVLLYVGSIFNRRHLPVLIEAFGRIDSDAALVIIGENRTHPHQDLRGLIEKMNLTPRVRLLEYVAEKAVQDYYQMSDLFIYLSSYEGFGIPPLEAMSYGVPVILSEVPAMDEVYKGAARFVKSNTVEDVTAAIRDCLADSVERSRLSREGLALANRHRWENTVQIISQDWEQLLAAHR